MTSTHGYATLRQTAIMIGLHENTLYVLSKRHAEKGFPAPKITTPQLSLYDPDEIALWYAERHPIETR